MSADPLQHTIWRDVSSNEQFVLTGYGFTSIAAFDKIVETFTDIYLWLPQALSLLAMCRQDKLWRTKEGEILQIPKMDILHARNLVRWLERRAQHIKVAAEVELMVEAAGPHGDAAQDAIEEAGEELNRMDALVYLRSQPLYKAVVKRANSKLPPSQPPYRSAFKDAAENA